MQIRFSLPILFITILLVTNSGCDQARNMLGPVSDMDTPLEMMEYAGYAHPNVLVSTEWVAKHGNDPGIRLIEVDEYISTYNEGHIAGAIGLSWRAHLTDQIRRDVLPKGQFEALCSERGIANDHTLIFYGDKNNLLSTYAFWEFRYHGHDESKLKVMDGGRKKWIAEGRELVTDIPEYSMTMYQAKFPDENVRATADDIMATLGQGVINLVDVRSSKEYTGEIISTDGNETAQRAGHIPGATLVTWSNNMNEDGTFKSYDELLTLYTDAGITSDKETVSYCRLGSRASNTWFTLKYLLGYDKVRNYDGSWTEWGNLVGVPIVKLYAGP